MALVMDILYAINCDFVKTLFSETIFIDVSALLLLSFYNSDGNSTTQMVTDDTKFFIKIIDSS